MRIVQSVKEILMSTVHNGNLTMCNTIIFNNEEYLMKSSMVLTTLIALSAVGLHADNNGRLNFLVNNERCIKAYSAQGMSFLVQPTDFVGKVLFDAVILSEQDRNNLVQGFDEAQVNNTQVEVPYTLENIQFLAKITPLIKGEKSNFFVEVQAQ